MKALIAGATGTIGSAIAQRLNLRGAHVTTIGRTPPEAANHIPCDFSTDGVPDLRAHGSFDAVVLAAGVDSRLGYETWENRSVATVMHINAISQISLARAAIAVATGPIHILACSSDTLITDEPESIAYSMSKAALEEGLRLLMVEKLPCVADVVAMRMGFVGVPMATCDGHTADRDDTALNTAVLAQWLDRIEDYLYNADRELATSSRYAIWE